MCHVNTVPNQRLAQCNKREGLHLHCPDCSPDGSHDGGSNHVLHWNLQHNPCLTWFFGDVYWYGLQFNGWELGKNWVPLSRTTEDQELVTTGISSRVRHPFYLSILVLFSGVALISQNLWGLIFHFIHSWLDH